LDNADVARIFDEIADLLEILDENPFRVRAYRNAARTVRVLGEPLASLAGEDGAALAKLPGIGKDLAGKILEILKTGDLELRRELTKKIPATLLEMMRVQGVGPKRARQFYQELGIRTLQELEDAARSGRLLKLRGMGPTLQGRILQGISAHRARLAIPPGRGREAGPAVRRLPAQSAGHRDHRGRGQLQEALRHGRRRGHPGGGRERAADRRPVRRVPRGRAGPGARHNALFGPAAERASG